MQKKRKCKEKWAVYGVYGGYFTNLKDARICAKECSKCKEYDYHATIWLLEDDMNYLTYEHGKCVRDGWTIKR